MTDFFMKAILMILFHICFLPKMLWAQRDSVNTWLSIDAGQVNKKLLAGLSINYQEKNTLFSFRYMIITPVFRLDNEGNISEFSPMIGFGTNKRDVSFSASGGLSLVKFTSYSVVPAPGFQIFPSYKKEKTTNYLGLPISLMVNIPLSNRAGLGFGAIANINKQQSYYGLLGSLQFGKVRYKR